MPSKELYLAAQAFQRAKLWEALYDTELFAVRYANGEIGYASVIGHNKEHFALTLYMGHNGLYSFSRMESLPEDASYALRRDAFLSQECLACSFESVSELADRDRREMQAYGFPFVAKMPLFRKNAPFKYPWFVEEKEDEQRLLLAFRAGVAVADRIVREGTMAAMTDPNSSLGAVKEALGFTEDTLPVLTAAGEGFSWKSEPFPDEFRTKLRIPVLTDELGAARLKRMKPHPGRRWYCHVMMLPHAMQGQPPRFPAMLLLLDSEKGMAKMPMVVRYPEECAQMTGAFLDNLEKEGMPECVYALGKVTYDLLAGVAGQIGMCLMKVDRLPELEEVEGDLLTFLEPGGGKGGRTPAGPVEAAQEAAVEQWSRKPKPDRRQSVGVCQLCGEMFDKSAMLAHLKKCVARKAEPGEQKYFLLKVEGSDAPEYFLYLDVMADTTLKRLDQFLRDIWLECCGHMSAFDIKGTEYFSSALEPGDRGMGYKLENLVSQGQVLKYEYDFGSYTDLKLKVSGGYTAKKRRSKIVLLARNKAPEFACVKCGQPAALVTAGFGDGLSESAYCRDCAQEKEANESFLPIMNSPRCGVCGYGVEWEEDGE